MIFKKKFIMPATFFLAIMIAMPFTADAKKKGHHAPYILSGEVTIEETTVYPNGLIIADDAVITSPETTSLTMTVNGVETGQKLVTTAGVDTKLVPGVYRGRVVLTVAEENLVEYQLMGPPGMPPQSLFFPFRQAIYVNGSGVEYDYSVPSAVTGGKVTNSYANAVKIISTGECFDGIYVIDGNYKVKNAKIKFTGNGRSDFVGYGAGIVGYGDTTTLVIDHTKIINEGVARSAVIADGGSNVIVKNSYIQTYNGILPDDYIPTIDTGQMRSVPWMLSLSGNCRATNLLGTNTKASYINSYIGAEGWGVLSTDGCTTPTLTAINSTIAITGEDGYGSYGIGEATEYFLGCNINVATYATISRGSYLFYGDSDPEKVAQLNTDLGLGLTGKELRLLRKKRTMVNSRRFGIMWHGGGTLDISGGTVFNTGETTFLDKGQAIAITVDGSKGAKLFPHNGVIMQVMDDDDPGPVPPEMTNTGIYHQPTGPVAIQPGHNIYETDSEDAVATFSNIRLRGDFYNGMRGDIPGPFGPPSPRNMGLTFDNAFIRGVITSSTALHSQDTITAEDYRLLGEVTNTPSEAVNNGVIVSLMNGSEWIVKGTCYLTGLNIDAGSAAVAPEGYTLTMTVDDVVTTIVPGSYSGNILLTVE